MSLCHEPLPIEHSSALQRFSLGLATACRLNALRANRPSEARSPFALASPSALCIREPLYQEHKHESTIILERYLFVAP